MAEKGPYLACSGGTMNSGGRGPLKSIRKPDDRVGWSMGGG